MCIEIFIREFVLQSWVGRGVFELELVRFSEVKKIVVKYVFFKGKNLCCVVWKCGVVFFEINFVLQIYERLYIIYKVRKCYVKW